MGVGEEKPGLGGSASATVGVAACCFALGGRDLVAERSSLLRLALDAHRRAQAGHGSGYDVATVLHGGVVLWRPRLLEARQLAWPDGLHFIAGYSGQSASTGALLGRAGRRAPDAPADLGRLAREVGRLVAAFSRGEVPEILDSVRACRRELSEWDRRHGLGIVTAALARMMEGAEALGAAAKISGAGGGDSVLAFADRADVLHGVARAWRAEGFEPLTVALSSRGVEELSAP
jgi:phosphomevalonate kinase